MTGGQQDITVELDPADLAGFRRDVAAFDRHFTENVERELLAEAQPATAAVRLRLLAGGPSRTGLRRGLAAGTKASSTSSATDGSGVTIQTTGADLPAEKQALVYAFNKPSFRHPVPHDQAQLVSQSGRPYFGIVLEQRKPRMATGVERAVERAASTIEAGTVTA